MVTASIQMIGVYLLKRGGFMKIETKYDIGQEVWTLDFFEQPRKGEIL